MKICQVIELIMQKKGYLKSQLARDIGLPASNISYWTRQDANPSLHHLVIIRNYCKQNRIKFNMDELEC